VALRFVVLAEEAAKAVTSPKVQEAVADALERAITFAAGYTGGTGIVKLPLSGGTYALADLGRRKARKTLRSKGRKRKGKRRTPLMTPWGLRTSVKGSTWEGFHLTDRLSPKALDAAQEAALDEGLRAFAQVD
jgi:hypothetical protein